MSTDTPTRKINAGEIAVGNLVGKTRKQLREVTAIEDHPKMVRLTFADGQTAQPAKTTIWWIADASSDWHDELLAGEDPRPKVADLIGVDTDGKPAIADYEVWLAANGLDDDESAREAYENHQALARAADAPAPPDDSVMGYTPGEDAPPKRNRKRATQTAGNGEERVTFKDAAEKVLRGADGPMKVKQIAERAIPLVRPVPTGKTPAATLGAHLIVDANKGGRFVKTAPGTFDVREINPRGAAKRPAKRGKK